MLLFDHTVIDSDDQPDYLHDPDYDAHHNHNPDHDTHHLHDTNQNQRAQPV